MKLYLSIYVNGRYDSGQYTSFEKELPGWTAAPHEGDTIFVGADEDGKVSSINARVVQPFFCSYGQGEIIVEAEITNCREQYAALCASMLRDGFVQEFKR